MSQPNPGGPNILEDLKKAATISLEELAKLMTDQGLFGSHSFLDNNDQELEKLEKQAKLSPNCRFETG
ncbi:MAG: hypothetical protein ACE5OZ_02070 [Candidatus Heimdallarchaeota archaeon]